MKSSSREDLEPLLDSFELPSRSSWAIGVASLVLRKQPREHTTRRPAASPGQDGRDFSLAIRLDVAHPPLPALLRTRAVEPLP
jgi:hypothetical protein